MMFSKNLFLKINVKKSILIFIASFFLFSCKSILKSTSSPALYEVLTEQKDGGAHIRFFEILSEPREIKMLLGDANLKKKINQEDINTCNFIILNLGEKEIAESSILIKNVTETADKIIIETEEKQSGSIKLPDFVYPYAIVKINSKKEIVIK